MLENLAKNLDSSLSAFRAAENLSREYSEWRAEHPKTAGVLEATTGIAAIAAGGGICARLVKSLSVDTTKEIVHESLHFSNSSTLTKAISIDVLTNQHEHQWRQLYDSYAAGYGKTNSAAADSALSWIKAPTPKLEALVARTDSGGIAGFIHFRPVPRALNGTNTGYIEDLYVDPEFRRAGVASKLIASVADRAKERGWESLSWITSENNSARGLYDQIAKPSETTIHQLQSAKSKNSAQAESSAIPIKSEMIGTELEAEWKSLFHRYYGEKTKEILPSATVNQTWDWLSNSAQTLEGLIARAPSGEPVGIIHFREFPRPLHGGSTGGYVNDLYVVPEWRRKGVGTKLFYDVSKVGQDRNWDTLRWDVPVKDSNMLDFSARLGNVVKRAGYEMPLR